MQELSLEALMRIVRQFWKWMVFCGAVGGLLMALVTQFFIPEKYVSQATLLIQNGTLLEGSTQISTANLAAAQTIVDQTAIIFSSDIALKPAIKLLDDDTTVKELREALSFSATDNSEAVIIKATANDPETAYAYCSALVDVSSGVMEEIYEIAKVKELNSPRKPTDPSSPNLIQNTLLGVIIGAFLMAGAAIVHYMTDMRIGNEEDLKQRMTDIVILGEIPAFSDSKKEVRRV